MEVYAADGEGDLTWDEFLSGTFCKRKRHERKMHISFRSPEDGRLVAVQQS